MPIYEYRCSRCAHEFEEIVSGSGDDNTPPCPSCGSSDTRKLMSCACRCHSGDGGGDYDYGATSDGGGCGGGGCAGCSGGHCGSCH